MIRHLSLTALLLSAGLPAFANPDGEAHRLPVTTQAFASGRMLPKGDETVKTIRRLQQNPLFSYLLQQFGGSQFTADVTERMIGWVDGKVTLAWVRTGDVSSIDHFQRREAQAPVYEEIKRKLGYIGEEVEKFRKRYKRMPNSWQEMIQKKVRKTVPQYEHASFELVTNPPSVRVSYKGDLKLEEFADAPSWTPGDGVTSGRVKPFQPLNVVVAMKTTNDANCRTQLNALLGAPKEGERWTLNVSSEYSPWTISLQNGWVVGSDNPALVDGFQAPTGPGLDINPRYQFQRQQLPKSAGEQNSFVFIDIEDVLKTTKAFGEVPESGRSFRSLGFSYSDTVGNGTLLPSEGWVEGMLQVDAPGNTTWTSANVTSDFSFADDVSADSQTVYAVNVPAAVGMLNKITESDAMAATIVNALWTQFQTSTGITTNLTETSQKFGWAIFETEMLDGFVSELQGFMGTGEDTSSGLVQYLSKSSGAYTIQVKDPALVETAATSLWKDSEETPRSETVGTSRFWARPNGGWAMAALPQKVLASSKVSRRLLLRTLDTLAVPGSGLSRHSSLTRFRREVRGEMLMFTSAKMDWLYSILKGLMLLLDGTTRPEAETLGRYRDSYAAVTLDPQGLRMYSAFYSETPVAAAPVTAPNPEVVQLRAKLAQAYEGAQVSAETGATGVELPTNPFAKSRAQGQYTACMSNLKNIATACEMYATDYSGLYPARLDLLTKGGSYLRTMPTCPSANQDTYSAHYKVGRKPDRFTVYCWGHNHKLLQIPANRPAYNAEQGLIVR